MHTNRVIVLAALGLASSAHADILRLSGSGNVVNNFGSTQVMTGTTFTYSIDLDTDTPDIGGGVSLANFEGAVVSFTVDGVAIDGTDPGLTRNYVQYLSLLGEAFEIAAGFNTALDFRMNAGLPAGTFGVGPAFTILQLEPLEFADLFGTPFIEVNDLTTGSLQFAQGTITSMDIAIILNECPADLAPPIGVLNFFDLGEFLTRFNAQDPSVDFAAPFGVWNFFDLGEFLTLFNGPCIP